ncbi:MAG: calcium/sodium antiporter [Clostridiales bacterium]|nr:calcium/sodium antiporter [Clostridiales bacterium]
MERKFPWVLVNSEDVLESLSVYLFFLIGLAFIIKGGDIFVDASSWIAKALGLPEFLVGATVVSIATTLPELFVSAIAASQGRVEMAVSNAVGSSTANLGLILAISVIFAPQTAERKLYGIKALLLTAALLIILLFSLSGSISIIASIMLIAVFLLFVFENIASLRTSDAKKAERVPAGKREIAVNSLKFVFGAAGIVIGADLLVDNGTIIAHMLSIPDSVIGATVIAVGTSIPELVTAIAALKKGSASLSVGNILGANIIDVTLILPLCSLVSGSALPVAGQNLMFDIPACLVLCLIALIPMIIKQRFSRLQGTALLGAYIGYILLILL